MRIISFTKKWGKLSQPEFTTFRFPRKDKDWYVGEIVQVFFKSRSPQREKLGEAEIIAKEIKLTGDRTTDVTDAEAKADGFRDILDMETWMRKTYGTTRIWARMNKLTLRSRLGS